MKTLLESIKAYVTPFFLPIRTADSTSSAQIKVLPPAPKEDLSKGLINAARVLMNSGSWRFVDFYNQNGWYEEQKSGLRIYIGNCDYERGIQHILVQHQSEEARFQLPLNGYEMRMFRMCVTIPLCIVLDNQEKATKRSRFTHDTPPPATP